MTPRVKEILGQFAVAMLLGFLFTIIAMGLMQ